MNLSWQRYSRSPRKGSSVGRLRKRWEVRRQKRKYSQGVGWNIHVDGEVTQIMAGLRGECKSEPDSEVLSE